MKLNLLKKVSKNKILVFLSVNSEDPRIVGGVTAIANQTNHQVSIRVKSYEIRSLGYGHFCGGSVISTRTVLTAAHCFYGKTATPDSYVVVVGTLMLTGFDADRTEISVIKEIVLHSGFDPDTFENDVAVVYVRFLFFCWWNTFLFGIF